MRLLDTTSYDFESFTDTEVPKYAILSHRWGSEEVSYQDMQQDTYKDKLGFAKIKDCCAMAKSRGIGWAWIDTCCIDKTSSAELSEAINAMFQWYQNAEECYAYLSDVPASTTRKDGLVDFDEEAFRKSDWFTRGWTLQELLAPSSLLFLNMDFKPIGNRSHVTIQPLIAKLTGIDSIYLADSSQIHSASVAQRFSWIAHRHTTRLEDMAYCLLGIFNINMPLLYGEGRRAFIRLQSEIMKQSDDESIFAWVEAEHTSGDHASGLLAEWPSAFAKSGFVKPTSRKSRMTATALTSRGIDIGLVHGVGYNLRPLTFRAPPVTLWSIG
ncbi:HET-domain-containing protein [Polychaeton citri CBS 116435]|uniref:HET-domain-containing protein n=1 Tax=Polychaeton citri CBS 116435 TaxID=1314669 RepID=A0A9P4QG73_9PEZI|nr:HET-domain-containing protein [Polychaeton citri CBS 116435]